MLIIKQFLLLLLFASLSETNFQQTIPTPPIAKTLPTLVLNSSTNKKVRIEQKIIIIHSFLIDCQWKFFYDTNTG
jgi:hypothetical protein